MVTLLAGGNIQSQLKHRSAGLTPVVAHWQQQRQQQVEDWRKTKEGK
jgi:hypothetical protein